MLLKSVENNIATLTLNRPEIHNAFNNQLISQLITEFENIENDPAICAVILTANGKSFCAGADLNWMREMINYSYEENLKDALLFVRLMQILNNFNKPTVALVQGAAYGGGVGLIASCDIAIVSMEASFCFPEVRLGLIPAVISPYVIAAIGERATRRYFLTGEIFDPQEALRIGLVHQVVSPHDLKIAGKRITETMLKNDPIAITKAKKLIAKISNIPINEELLNLTAKEIAEIRVSGPAQVRLKKFLDKKHI